MSTSKTISYTVILQEQGGLMRTDFESIVTPLPEDILCGKNKVCIKHEGSKNFRRIIESYTLKYQLASSRQAKMDITKEIYDRLQTRRFLKYNEETDLWETLHPLAVRDKIGHALRFSNRKGSTSIRKQVRHSTSDLSSLSTNGLQNSSHSIGSTAPRNCSDSIGSTVQRNCSEASHRQSTYRLSQCTKQSSLQQHMRGVELLNDTNMHVIEQQQLVQPEFPPFAPYNVGSANWSAQLTGPIKHSNHGLNEMDLSWMLQMPLLEL